MTQQSPRCKTSIKIIHSFLNATGGNWRNSAYIECRHCKYEKSELCAEIPDLLYAPAMDGTPLLLPAADAEIIFARRLDKSECLLEMSNLRFQELFKQYITHYCDDKTHCPLLAICEKQSEPESW